MRPRRGLPALLIVMLLAAAACDSSRPEVGPDPEGCGDQDAETVRTVVVDVDGDGERDSIRLTDGAITTCTVDSESVFEHPMATEHIVPWSFGPDHPMGLLFGESTVSLLELRVATWTDDGWQVVTDGLRNPVVLRAGSEGTTTERHHLYDHQCGTEPTQIVSTDVNLLGEVPVVTDTTWNIDGTTATATAESHEDSTVNPQIWFERRATVPCPWMEAGV